MGIEMAEPRAMEGRSKLLALSEDHVIPEPGNTTDGNLQGLHRLATREMLAAEIVTRSITEYPEMPWEFMVDMARICWDRVRHAEIGQRRVEELGGRLGMYPIHPADWALYQHRVKLDLVYRLCDLALLGDDPFQNQPARRALAAEAQGDSTPRTHRYIQADEQRHVRSSLRWLKWLTADDVGSVRQIIERAKRLRVMAGLADV